MLVLPNQLLYWVLSTSDQCFASFQPILCHPHTQIRIILFHNVRISIPNWKPSPNRTSIGFSQTAFPIRVLPKDDGTDFAQEERLGLPYWTMILATCVVVDESKCLDIPIWEFSVIWEHPPFLPGCKQILHQLLVLRIVAVWIWYPWLLLHRETKFIIGFDFAVTLSSPESVCVLFDITSEHLVELKWLILNKHKRWFHSSRVKFPLVSMSASWFLVSMYLIWILGS